MKVILKRIITGFFCAAFLAALALGAVETKAVYGDFPLVWTDEENGGIYRTSDFHVEMPIQERVTVRGNVTLVLEDDTGLNMKKGIEIPAGSSLTIEGGPKGNGQLAITDIDYLYAGIGGSPEVDGGDVTINGGELTFTGKHDHYCCIGSASYQSFGLITINGGTINISNECNGYWSGMIGAGYSGNCAGVIINGGQIHTIENKMSYGTIIGAGTNGNVDRVVVNGGTLTLQQDDLHSGSMLGAGSSATCGSLEINGGTLTFCRIGGKGVTIGAGYGGTVGTLSIAEGLFLAASDDLMSVAPVDRSKWEKENVFGLSYLAIGKCEEHQFSRGVCLYCGEADPDYVPGSEGIFDLLSPAVWIVIALVIAAIAAGTVVLTVILKKKKKNQKKGSGE